MNTTTTWWFTPDEFAWIWEAETDSDEIPFPISIIETPGTAEEYARLRHDTSARYPRRADPDLTAPLRMLADPDLTIASSGRMHNSTKRLRALAVAVADRGVILYQRDSENPDFGSDLKLVVTSRTNLGRHLSAALPQTPAGAVGPLAGHTPRVRGEEPPRSWLRDNDGKRPVEERIRRLLRLRRTAEGYLRIEHRPGGRSRAAQYLSWIDVHTDTPAPGRYVIDVHNDDTTVTPVSPDALAQQIYRRAALDVIG